MGYNDLGDFYYQLGDLPAALKSYAQARDYCTADKHIIEMCLNVIKVNTWATSQWLRGGRSHSQSFVLIHHRWGSTCATTRMSRAT
jgi:hypothetical protein